MISIAIFIEIVRIYNIAILCFRSVTRTVMVMEWWTLMTVALVTHLCLLVTLSITVFYVLLQGLMHDFMIKNVSVNST